MQRALGHWDEAVANLRRAIELDPRNIRASNNLALTYCAMRRFPEAVATLDRVLAWDPTNARALLTKADALMAIGDLQAAEPLLAQILRFQRAGALCMACSSAIMLRP